MSHKENQDIIVMDGQGSTPSNPASGFYKLYIKDSDGKPYYLNSSGTETQVGSGSGSGINYVTNPDAETDTTGWTTYDDLAATPVDLTSGTFGGTFARTTTTPLRGTGSFLYTPGSIGEGVAYTITPDLADYGRVMEFSFDYDFVSATGATGDYCVWVYGVTSGTLIQPAGYQVVGSATGVYNKFLCTFQTTMTDVTYRIGIHQTTATSAALEFDNVYCGPQTKSLGSIVTDWVSYTPTGSWVSNATYSGYWQRVGDSMDVNVRVDLTGAPTAVELTINLPSGYSIDSTKLLSDMGNSTDLGLASVQDTGTGSYTGRVRYNNTTSVSIVADVSSGTYGGYAAMSATVPMTFANTDIITASFRVPISGWSSAAELSSQSAEGRVVAARYYLGASVTGTADAILKYDTKVYDTHSAYSTTTGLYTCPAPGYYVVLAGCYLLNSSAPNDDYLDLQRDGVGYARSFGHKSTSETAGESYTTLNAVLYCNAGQTLGIYVNGDASHDQYAGVQTNLNIFRLSGNQSILASESVVAAATNSAGNSISTGTWTDATWNAEITDSHGALGSSIFTAPISGTYLVTGNASFVPNSSGQRGIRVVHNSTPRGEILVLPSGTYNIGWTTTAVLKMLAGDTAKIQVYQESSGSLALTSAGSYNAINIVRVGNY